MRTDWLNRISNNILALVPKDIQKLVFEEICEKLVGVWIYSCYIPVDRRKYKHIFRNR